MLSLLGTQERGNGRGASTTIQYGWYDMYDMYDEIMFKSDEPLQVQSQIESLGSCILAARGGSERSAQCSLSLGQ